MTIVRAAMAVLAAGLVLVTTAGAEAQNVQRRCKVRIDWSSQADNRIKARAQAIDGWSAAARAAHGEDFGNWAIAGVARVSCVLTPEGHRCRAAASPCKDVPAGPLPGVRKP
jgi:hypothetical protein